MFTCPDINKKSAHRLQCKPEGKNKPKEILRKVTGEEYDNKTRKDPNNKAANSDSVNNKSNEIKDTHIKSHPYDDIFGAGDLSMGLGNLIAFYLFTRTKSIPTDKIVYYFIENPHLLGKYFPKDDFYFPQFFLWIGVCAVIFGIRCLLFPEQLSKKLLIIYDIFFSILMLLIPAYSTIRYFTFNTFLNLLFFLIVWGILYFSRMYLFYEIL